ncbi:MAG TPA: XRE family transcriptional regulator [Candidatus Limnocylindrales bacterium]|nr:XRE family transcriptional regulator [Candidatus Limnocylindrales bacterium]
MAVRAGTEATPGTPAEPTAPIEVDLGARIRALRLARGQTLRQLAAEAGVTESFLSQVERGVASPSIATVQRIARALGQSIAELFAADGRAGSLVRAGERRRVVYQGLGAIDEFLTRSTDGKLQVILSTIEPGGGTGDEPYTHDSDEEVVIVLEGSLDLWVGAEHYRLEAGDAVTHASRIPHRNTNPGPGVARVLFCITPPSY